MQEFETVIGIEVHVQLKTKSKIFCGCSTDFTASANTNICPVCCGYPGVLPVFNRRALELGVRAGLALNCTVNDIIYFERKNYFYPDLPKGYQISQYKQPLAWRGWLELISGAKIGITRAHLEEDAGKLIHKETCSLVDLNRTGVPLLEIVSEPDIRGPQEAFDYLTALKLLLRYIDVSDCDMENGSLRCDVNISLRPKGQKEFGVRIELKNMNSFKGVRDALIYEEKRQAQILIEGGTIKQETMLWDADLCRTQVLRVKEEAHDYRYFPEPDLLNFTIQKELIESQKLYVGELPLERRKRFMNRYALTEKETDVLLSSKQFADYFEAAVKIFNDPKRICGWLLGPMLELINACPQKIHGLKLTPENFAKVVQYFAQDKINNHGAKKILVAAFSTNEDVDTIIQNQGLIQISDTSQIGIIIDDIVAGNAKIITEIHNGNDKAIMALVGQVMKKTNGKANPKLARELLEKAVRKEN